MTYCYTHIGCECGVPDGLLHTKSVSSGDHLAAADLMRDAGQSGQQPTRNTQVRPHMHLSTYSVYTYLASLIAIANLSQYITIPYL
jgi:hypothetical protein